LVVGGPNLMDGYYGRPDETALALRDGWLYTGDIARMDEDGYFYIVDRKKELIIVSGYNVYPREVEEALYAHPAVLEAAAIGVPHPERGEVVKAFVVLRPGFSATPDELRARCASSLARFKIPAEIEFRSDLPKSIVGKVLRRALADEERASRVARETAREAALTIDELRRVCVVGAGLMGRQIALNAAHHGFTVRIWDANAGQLQAAERWTDEYIAGRIE